MILCGLDFETNWCLDTDETRIIEIGAVLYCTERKMPVEIMSTLVKVPESLVCENVTSLTGLTYKDIEQYGVDVSAALTRLSHMFYEAEYAVAHNGTGFDKPVYLNECARNSVQPMNIPWIDTRTDIEFPAHIKTRKLTHLAADLGFANPFAHRALFDVMTMMKVLEMFDLDSVIALSKEPTMLLTASVSFADKDLAKERGFFWNGDDKKWQKIVKQSQADKIIEEAPFLIAAKDLEQ